MNPALPQIDPLPLPGPVWLLWALLLLTFLLHLLPMNVLLGGSFVAGVTRWRARGRADSHEARLADWLAHAMPVVIAATVTLGVAALLFVQVLYGRLFFASSIVMGWFWLAVVLLVILGYHAAYLMAFRGHQGRRWPLTLVWVMAAVFLAVGFIYSNNMTLMLRPAEIAARYQADARGLQLNLGEPTLVPRFLHMLLGAVAVSGLAVSVLGVVRQRREAAFSTWAIRYGLVWFLGATVVNGLAGFYWLGALPRETMLQFVGGDAAATGVLAGGIALGLVAIGLAILALTSKRPVGFTLGGVAAAVLTLVLMVMSRDHVRQAALQAAGFTPATWIVPQWGPIAIFGVLLVAAIAIVIWMVAQLAAPAKT